MDLMNKQEELWDLKHNPDFTRGIYKGLLASHLGHVYSWRLVKNSIGLGGVAWVSELICRLKKLHWLLKRPYEKLRHRNCPTCKNYRRIIDSEVLPDDIWEDCE